MDEILDKLSDYRHAVEVRVGREIDAGCCQTNLDYRRRDEARDKEDQVREELEALIDGAICQRSKSSK